MKLKALLIILAVSGLVVLQAENFAVKATVSNTQDGPAKKAATKKPAPKKAATKKPATKAETSTVKVGDTITTTSGLKYVITKHNANGTKVNKGDKIEAHYTGTLKNGKKFDSSRDRNQPFSFVVGNGQVIAGWDEGFTYLRQGDSATLIIPPGLGYGEMDMGDIPSNSTLYFNVEVMNVIKGVEYIPYSGEGKDTITLKSGLRYIIIDKGDVTQKARPEQTASMYYAGYLNDGSKFDANFGTFQPFDLKIMDAPVIEGWKQMLPLMNKGMKVRAILPGNLAYGERGYPGVIPPNATLIFDMYMVDLK